MAAKDKETEDKILLAARNVFIEKGLAGARMQDIANRAGYNKALLHYYFVSKENLFHLVFEQEFEKFFANMAFILAAEIPLFEKIEQVVSLDIERMTEFPGLPNFVLNEMTLNPGVILKRIKNIPLQKILADFQKQINREVKQGNIIKITAQQLLINIQSLCVFPFIARPMIKGVMNMDDKNYSTMMKKRKSEVAGFIIRAIKT